METQLLQRKAFTWGLAYSVRGLVHSHQGMERDNTQAGVVLEK